MVKPFGKVASHETCNWQIPFHFQAFLKVPKTTTQMNICQIFSYGPGYCVVGIPLMNKLICILWQTL